MSGASASAEAGAAEAAGGDEGHEELWAAMATVTVRDCAPAAARRAAAPAGLAGNELNESDSVGDSGVGGSGFEGAQSQRSSSTSSTSDSSGAGWGGGARVGVQAGSSASTGPSAPEGGDPDDAALLTLQDLFGPLAADEEASADSGPEPAWLDGLPAVEDERQRLDELATRRRAVEAIAARYSAPSAAVSRQPPPVTHSPSAGGPPARPRELLGLARTGGPAAPPPPPGGLAFGARTPETESVDEATFTPLVPPEETLGPVPASGGDPPSAPARRGGAAAREARAVFGPAAPHDAAAAAAALRRLRDDLGLCGLGGSRRVLETADIVRELGARLGELDGAPPAPAPPPGRARGREGASPPPPRPGDVVVLRGLARAGLNGLLAEVLPGGARAGRLPLRVEASGQEISVKAENVEEASDLRPRPNAVPESGGAAAAAAGPAAAAAWPCSEERLAEGLRADERRHDEMWVQFLAGDDQPVGGDVLPSPDQFRGDS